MAVEPQVFSMGFNELWSMPELGVGKVMIMMTMRSYGSMASVTLKKWACDNNGYSVIAEKSDTINSIDEAFDFFGHDWLACNLYDMAGIDDSLNTLQDADSTNEHHIKTPIGAMISSADGVSGVMRNKSVVSLNRIHKDWADYVKLSTGDNVTGKLVGIKTDYHDHSGTLDKKRVVKILNDKEDIEYFYQGHSNGNLLCHDADSVIK